MVTLLLNFVMTPPRNLISGTRFVLLGPVIIGEYYHVIIIWNIFGSFSKNKFLPSPTVVYIVFKLFFVDFIDSSVLSTTAKI